MSQPLNDKEIRTRLKTLDPPKLIDILISVMEDNNSAIIQAARWNNNESRYGQGMLGESDYKIERARILSALTSMVDDLERGELEAAARELPEKGSRNHESPGEHGRGNTAGGAKERIILFLSANPTSTGKLQLVEEHQKIHFSLQTHRQYNFQAGQQVNWRELNAYLLNKDIKNSLYVFHFSGHGNKEGAEFEDMCRSLNLRSDSEVGVVLYDDDKRQPMIIAEDVWLDFFVDARKSCPNLEVLIFNACYSETLAKTVSKAGLYVVGVHDRVKDSAAIQFSSGFYAALVQDEPLKNAVNSGCRQARPYGLKKMEDVKLFYNGEEVEV